jgi:cell pole-organizing protein PopZ
MSSTERAPEPTMEEILASIRRIIKDDDTGQAKAKVAAPSQQDEESLEGEGEADSRIIDDIARVLSAGTPSSAADEEEEILDLTAELGGLEFVNDDEPETLALEPEPAPQEAQAAPEPEPAQAQTAPAPQMEMPQAPPPVAAEAPMAPQAPVAPPAPAQAQAPQPSASLEAASALERAIAALRAGQVPTSTTPQAEPFYFQAAAQPEPMPQPEPMGMPEPEPIPMAIPMATPEPQFETHPDQEPQFEAEPQREPEPTFEFRMEPEPEPVAEPEELETELVLTEVEMTVVTDAEEEPVDFEAAPAEPETEKAPFWPSETTSWEPSETTSWEEEASPEPEPEPEPEFEPEPEPVAAQVNGSGAHGYEAASKTLEDSVKDMLRPMLRQWLDENMPRMVTAALKDELGAGSSRNRQD